MFYVLITVCLALTGAVALLCGYMFFLHTVRRHDKRRITQLENELRRAGIELKLATYELDQAESQLAELKQEEEESWPEFIDV